MLGFIQLLLLQTALFVGIVWSSCDIEFASSPSINATVNQTVLVVCRSNCTPIRLVTKQGTDQEEEIRLYTKLQPVSDYEYDVGAELLLDASLNNATLICRAFDNGKSYVKKSWIRLQESLHL